MLVQRFLVEKRGSASPGWTTKGQLAVAEEVLVTELLAVEALAAYLAAPGQQQWPAQVPLAEGLVHRPVGTGRGRRPQARQQAAVHASHHGNRDSVDAGLASSGKEEC